MTRGWWNIEFTGVTHPDDATLEHIAEQIKEGFTSGEILEDSEEEVEDAVDVTQDRPQYGWGWIDGEDDNAGDRWIQISELDYSQDDQVGFLMDDEIATIMLRNYADSVKKWPNMVADREAKAKRIVDALNACG